MREFSGGYDDGYRSCCPFWTTEPGSLVAQASRQWQFSGCHVLDAGSGEGKNAAFLASLGASVDAVEVSSTALANAAKLWPDVRGVNWICSDILRFETAPQSYDAVVAYGLTHCLGDSTTVESAIAKLLDGLRIGGLFIFCAFNDRRQELRLAHPGFKPTLIAHERYMTLLSGLDVIVASDSDLLETHPHNGIEHVHSLTRLMGVRYGA